MSNELATTPTSLTVPGLTLTPKEFFRATDVAKIIRKMLAKAFPGIKFSVTSEYYSMGSSVYIRWEDGPTQRQVNDTVSPLSQRGFDGMTDSTYYLSPCTINGVVVRTSCFISASRRETPATVEFSEQTCAAYGGHENYPFMRRLEVKGGQYILHPYEYDSDSPAVVVGTVTA